MPTARLYLDDPWRLEFGATVVAQATWQGRPAVVLYASAFYPEGGGQLGDRGRIGAAAVVDVQIDDAGVVHHVIEGEGPAPGATVDCRVDRDRRRLHMALHTGQHMLSRALLDTAGAETVSARLGETGCTIDLGVDRLDEARVAEAEALANAVVDDDLRIRAWVPEPGELAALPLRRAPKVADNIRVVAIGDYDVSPCGGTHCTGSAQVGLIRITGVERYKGMMRVWFDAGRRARESLWREAAALGELGKAFTCGALDVPPAIDRMRRELAAAQGELRRLAAEQAAALAEQLAAGARARGERQVIAEVPGGAEALRAIGKRLSREPELVCFLASPVDGGTQVLIARGPGADLDCGAWLGRAAARTGARGGGRPDRAEGRLPPGIDWPALVAELG